MTISNADAVWEGGLKEGKGSFTAGSGAFSGDYSFPTRFGNTPGTNPEELIAAAHAACVSMALAAGLEAAGTTPTRIATRATCTINHVEGGFRITGMKLAIRGTVPGMDAEAFRKAAASAKDGCPVSQALAGNVPLELDAQLETA
ncbi:MAG TPA: OsmC family peroxiredoxin [Gemmatimonadales bacterium]|nr:OsmC family peroxiredoxin [Gemmatimonadales bacterium]